MATYRKRLGKWQTRIQRKGVPDLSKTFESKSDAIAWARMIESEMDRGAYLDRTEADRTTLGEVLERYMREISPRKKAGQVEMIRIKRILRVEKICQYSCSILTGKLFAEWRDKRIQEVSGSTVNRELNLISHAINVARKEWGIHIDNPIQMIQRPRHNKPRERRLSPEEQKRLLAELELSSRNDNGTYQTGGTHNPWIQSIVELALETGMRMGELLALRWQDVELTRRTVKLWDTKNGDNRTIPLTVKATALLSGLVRSIDGRVFPTTREAVKRGFSRAVERATISDLHFHDLRHEAVSRLFEKDLNVMEVASISGHKTLQMLKRYTHLKTDHLLAKIG